MKNSKLLIGIFFSILVFASCSKDEADIVKAEGRTVSIDARSYDKWIYFSFSQGKEVDIVDPQESLDWDIAFLRMNVKTNSGKSGKGKAGSIEMLGKTLLSEVSEAPESGYKTDISSEYYAFTTHSMVKSPLSEVLGSWIKFSGPPPKYEILNKVFVVKTASGEFTKLKILDYYNEEAQSGHITFEYKYQAGKSRVFVE